jgi:sugar O-acyltransferase (sialic acid O-acetyltransferase NeuD family)
LDYIEHAATDKKVYSRFDQSIPICSKGLNRSNINAVIFDLDDTLYSTRSFCPIGDMDTILDIHRLASSYSTVCKKRWSNYCPPGLIIIGASGHGKVIYDIAKRCSRYLQYVFIDDHVTGYIYGVRIFSNVEDLLDNKFWIENNEVIVAVGDNHVRRDIVEKLNMSSVRFATLIHPDAIIADDVSIGEGTVVMAGAVINSSVVLGKHCIINTSVVIEHDNRVEDYVHISPHATLCGTVSVGMLTHVGAGVTVKNNVTICENSIIGAGAVVINDIISSGTYVGVPSKKIKP